MIGIQQFLLKFIFLLLASFSYAQQDKLFFRKDYTYISETQTFYKIHTIRRTFDDANRQCQLEGASLFYPNDTNEANAVTELWKKTQKPLHSVLIGASSLIIPGDFITVDGQPLSDLYNDWAPGRPGGDQCVKLSQDGQLDDYVCDNRLPFICRKPLTALNWDYACNMPDIGYKYEPSQQKCYKFHLEPKNWTDAYATCAAEQSYLAIVNSQDESNTLVRITADAPKDQVQGNYLRGAVHLGFLKIARGWVTIRGTRLEDSGFANWGPGQPDNAGGNEVCGSMFYSGPLNDINCDVRMFFICENDNQAART